MKEKRFFRKLRKLAGVHVKPRSIKPTFRPSPYIYPDEALIIKVQTAIFNAVQEYYKKTIDILPPPPPKKNKLNANTVAIEKGKVVIVRSDKSE